MALIIFLIFIFVSIIWLVVEFIQASTLNEFLDKKIMRRTMWIWLPFYALIRLSREVLIKKK
ncbi:MAG: hypothetical protein WC823_05710 [Parcubacteria group bacterium]|jgi:hypothetical protein